MTIGVDLGGTRIKVAEVDGPRVVRSVNVPTPAGKPASAALDAISEAVSRLGARPAALGVAIPGEVDRSGRCYRLPNVPGFEGVEIGRELGARLGTTVVVENDATTAALAEGLFGHGRTFASFLLVTLGTGIGGGLVIERRWTRGAHGFAGEIGHVTIDGSASARPCACGHLGCLEAYAGTRALLEAFREHGGEAQEIREVADSARRGEPAGSAAFARLSDALAVALNSVQNLLDLDAIVFTGGIANSFDLVLPRLRDGLRGRCYAAPLAEVPLLLSELGDTAGVVGAAHLPEHAG